MTERSFIQEAAQLLGSLMEDFQKKAIRSSDEIRFYECLVEVLRSLEKTKALDNRILIALERFHKSASFLIGLSSLKLDRSTYQKWRAYDAFYMEKVQPQLEIYGPILPL
ncbi:DNA helicase [Streptococcus sanguinis]|uniref:DNA helicase n=1 Tax=Streptococcus sanguinis TaxID=1305 RepID=UPI001CBFAD93|nr:DNA helicase [Streptococcus sanguinis]MBZ2067034.1 DNA helicase [Streptococcus sanguinis]